MSFATKVSIEVTEEVIASNEEVLEEDLSVTTKVISEVTE